LRNNKAPMGRKLKIYTFDSVASNNKTSKQDTVSVKESTAIASNTSKTFKEEKVVSYKDVVKYHKVKKGDNLGEISDKYGVSVAAVKKWNHIKGNNIAVGKSLKIIKNERVVTTIKKEVKDDKNVIETSIASNDSEKSSDFYVVEKGDNLFSISKKFNVSIEDLKKWNKIDDLNVEQGSKLTLAENDNTETDIANKAEVKIIEHVVDKGETIAIIAKKYDVSVSDIKYWNNLEDSNILLGTKLVVGKKYIITNDNKNNNSKKENLAINNRDEVKLYYVKKGDSLYSISKKYPGVTISDLKKWNGIKNESLKAGMKLKING